MKASLDQENIQASEILRLFLEISPMVIAADLESLANRAEELRKLEGAFEKATSHSAVEIARSFHRRLLLGINMIHTSMLSRDVVAFILTSTAHQIAEMACSAASGRGQLFELSHIIERLEETGDWDHTTAEVMLSDSLIERVHDSIFLEVLTRYGLSQFARHYENHRADYDLSCEVGRRLVSGNPVTREEHEKTVTRFRELHGPHYAKKLVLQLEANGLRTAP